MFSTMLCSRTETGEEGGQGPGPAEGAGEGTGGSVLLCLLHIVSQDSDTARVGTAFMLCERPSPLHSLNGDNVYEKAGRRG